MACLPLEKFFCWNLKTSQFASAIYVIISAFFALLLVILDMAASDINNGFEIEGGFRSIWRRHVAEGFMTCNVVMLFGHIIMIVLSIVLLMSVTKPFKQYRNYQIHTGWFWIMCIYVFAEAVVSAYEYSWYGKNTFRRPYLVFLWVFMLTRFILNMCTICISYSRLSEMDEEMRYGISRKTLPMSRTNLLSSQASFA
ncbi:unnamed protein product [Owenia fusiformis]|uniref:Uncharacterized protein n=1 Tax=Owenia fusiformis TaxID=6347 RepID=A0A8J1TI54_OWEFU|nr:unnamed protein product [Owenia fusiformis]